MGDEIIFPQISRQRFDELFPAINYDDFLQQATPADLARREVQEALDNVSAQVNRHGPVVNSQEALRILSQTGSAVQNAEQVIAQATRSHVISPQENTECQEFVRRYLRVFGPDVGITRGIFQLDQLMRALPSQSGRQRIDSLLQIQKFFQAWGRRNRPLRGNQGAIFTELQRQWREIPQTQRQLPALNVRDVSDITKQQLLTRTGFNETYSLYNRMIVLTRDSLERVNAQTPRHFIEGYSNVLKHIYLSVFRLRNSSYSSPEERSFYAASTESLLRAIRALCQRYSYLSYPLDSIALRTRQDYQTHLQRFNAAIRAINQNEDNRQNLATAYAALEIMWRDLSLLLQLNPQDVSPTYRRDQVLLRDQFIEAQETYDRVSSDTENPVLPRLNLQEILTRTLNAEWEQLRLASQRDRRNSGRNPRRNP